MTITLYIVALLLALVGVLGAVLPILPGAVFSVLALVIRYFCSAELVSLQQLLIWSGVCIFFMILDFVLPIFMTKRLGGSKSGMTGATIGMVVGLIAFPPFGILFGPFVGAVMGEMMNDKDDVAGAFKVGLATFFAFILSTGLKFIASLGVLWILIKAMYPALEIFFKGIFDKIA